MPSKPAMVERSIQVTDPSSRTSLTSEAKSKLVGRSRHPRSRFGHRSLSRLAYRDGAETASLLKAAPPYVPDA